MDLLQAQKCVDLMTDRDRLISMRQKIIEKPNCGWSLMINDQKFPIPTNVKNHFFQALDKALDHINSQIDKI